MSVRRRGLSLVTVLILVALLATMATAMVALFTTNLNLMQASNNGQVALNEAEAGLNQVVLNLAADPDYGTHQESFTRTLHPNFSSPDCYHSVSFNPGQTQVAYSTNAKAGATTGYQGRPVAAGCVHVVSTGYFHGQVRTVEAIVRQPPFNFALASAGPINSATPLRVEGVNSRQGYLQGQSKPLPGHLASNSPQGVTVSQGSTTSSTFVSGYARAAGAVTMDPNAVVLQGLRPNSAQLALPSIDVVSFDNLGAAGVQRITTATSNASTLSSTQRCDQATTFSKQVDFRNGFLYVNGNATFSAGLKGTGAIVVNGDVTIQGQETQLSGTDTVAILASGKVTIQGDPLVTVTPQASANYINGLVYGGKGVDLNNVTVAGIVLTKDPQSTSKLQNTNLMYSADAAKVEISVPPVVSSGGSDAPPVFFGQVGPDGKFQSLNPNDPNGKLYVGEPPGLPNDAWSSQLIGTPSRSLEDVVAQALTSNPPKVVIGRMQGQGWTVTNFNPPAWGLDDLAKKGGPNTDLALNPDPNLAKDVAKLFASGQTVVESGYTVTTPGLIFKLDLNSFLPRSSSLRVTAYCVHNYRL